MAKDDSFDALQKRVVKLDEDQLNINFSYKRPILLNKILGLHTISVNEYTFRRALRFKDILGNRPSFRSSLKFPGILFKYVFQKLSKNYILKKPLPFLVVDAVDFIEKHISTGSKVLEVGAGNSTLWFLKKGCNVTSIEHNKKWAKEIIIHGEEIIKKDGGKLLIEVSKGEEALTYLSKLDQNFDLILIDSMNEYTSRYEALKILKDKLSVDGIIILDNSDGVVNWKALAVLNGVKKRTFTGYAYNCPFVCQTTIWQALDIKSQKNLQKAKG